MSYIEGFVPAVPTANRDAYKKHAEQAAPVFKDHGAFKVVEWATMSPTERIPPSRWRKKDDETVVFSWIVWPSRQVRNEA
jgi:uncharacterized protein YbaA (DUF1428 family)